MRTCSQVFIISSGIFFDFEFKDAALCNVTPPNNAAAHPVIAVNRNVFSPQMMSIDLQNSKQNCCATSIAVLFPAPAGPVTNMSSWSFAPIFLRLSISFAFMLLVGWSSSSSSFAVKSDDRSGFFFELSFNRFRRNELQMIS